jgi:hypothetical protein
MSIRIAAMQQDACVLMRTFSFDVKSDVSDLARFENRFAVDVEAVQHSKDLAASLRQRHFNNVPGLVISVLDQTGREIHRELVYPLERSPP